MKSKRIKGLIGLSLTTLLVLGACGGDGGAGAEKAKGGSEKTAAKQEFKVVVQQEMPSADLSLGTDTISFTALNNAYEGIYRLDDKSKPQPAGAKEKVQVSDDGLTYTVKLREEAKWSNGDPVTVADYVFSWQRTADPQTGAEYAYFLEMIENGADIVAGKKPVSELGIKANGDYELEIKLAKPTPYFDYLLAFPLFFPQHQATVEKYGKDYAASSEKAVYNGPFVLANFEGAGSDTNWTLEKNENYWDKDNVKLDKINFDVVKEAPTALNLFQDGQADDVILSGELAQQMAKDPELVIEKEARTSYLEFNQRDKNSPYNNVNLRKAISATIDRNALVDKILGDGSVVATGLIPEGMSYSPTDDKDFADENKKIVEYSPEKAKEYWAKAKKELGITTLKMDIVADDVDSTKKLAEYIQGTLKDTLEGIDVTVSPVPFSVRIDRGSRGDFETILGGWVADYADPSSFLDLFVTGNNYNRGRFSSKAYDELIEASATRDASDPEKRWEDMVKAEKLLIGEETALAPLYQKATAHLRSKEVKGVVAHGAGAQYDYKWTYVTEE
ncbi:peptide ABC transporter substrate-binding protein [Enterococcus faecalis]|uniref:peptide ABC transporter substrate-binding protein n=1 Tax=Enterococcus faecalis TaxID=1351 RepID=UPI003A96A89B